MADHIELSKSALVERQNASHTLAEDALQLMKDNSPALMVAGAVIGATTLGAIGLRALSRGSAQFLASETEAKLAGSTEMLGSKSISKDGVSIAVAPTDAAHYGNARWDGHSMSFGDGTLPLPDPFIQAREAMVPRHMEAIKNAGR